MFVAAMLAMLPERGGLYLMLAVAVAQYRCAIAHTEPLAGDLLDCKYLELHRCPVCYRSTGLIFADSLSDRVCEWVVEAAAVPTTHGPHPPDRLDRRSRGDVLRLADDWLHGERLREPDVAGRRADSAVELRRDRAAQGRQPDAVARSCWPPARADFSTAESHRRPPLSLAHIARAAALLVKSLVRPVGTVPNEPWCRVNPCADNARLVPRASIYQSCSSRCLRNDVPGGRSMIALMPQFSARCINWASQLVRNAL